MMKSIFSALFAAVFAMGVASAAAEDSGNAQACLAMIKDHVGVDPSPKVIKLCEEGNQKAAMQAAMAGE